MKNKLYTIVITACFILLTFSGLFAQGFEHFITVKGANLMEGNKPFRFISFNIPNLNYVEDEMEFTKLNPYALPTEFEMRDAFETVKEMGGQVIRIYTIPVFNSNFPEGTPTYVKAPGKFNEEAFKSLDLMLALANEYQIRIIFSLLNNWQWMGGVPNYAAFRGKNQSDFWTDSQLIADFKQTIKHVITRRNTITGTYYKDDKAILCWETGNELYSTAAWNKEIAAYIKSLDSNHLLLDGYYAADKNPVLESSLTDPNIDIVSSHHYAKEVSQVFEDIQRNIEIINGRKPYFLGEFGFLGTPSITAILDTVISNDQLAGALIWSLRYRHRNGGFYFHSEPSGGGVYKSYHWPGFQSGIGYDERNFMQMYRAKAFQIQGKDTPAVSLPKAPNLLTINNVWSLNWQGSMGAEFYEIARKEKNSTSWQTIAFGVSDAVRPNRPLFHDKTAEIGKSYQYKVRAVNSTGRSEWSNESTLISVTEQALIDEMENYGHAADVRNLVVTSGEDRSFKESPDRLEGQYGSQISYFIPGNELQSIQLDAFEKESWQQLQFEWSADGQKWNEWHLPNKAYSSGETNYVYWTPRRYSVENTANLPIRYFKIFFRSQVQLDRLEIIYK